MLTQDKQVKSRLLSIVGHPVAAGAVIYKGALIALNATGFAVAATAAANLTVVGIARKGVDNAAGADGDATVEVRRDEAPLLKNDAVSPVTRTDIGSPCYIKDDETVTADNTGTSVAGEVVDIDDNGVWISF